MTKYVIIPEVEETKITAKEVDEWLATISLPGGYEIKVAGSILHEGFSYHDVDLELYMPKTEPCNCKDIMQTLPSSNWNTDLFCKNCGAVMRYTIMDDTWTWHRSETEARLVLEFPEGMRGVHILQIKEISDKVKTLEEKVKALEGKVKKP